MERQQEVFQSDLEIEKYANSEFDDDQKLKRTGNVWTGSAHIITAIIGSGVLSLAWTMAQLGWIIGVATLFIFSGITLYTSNLLADCYRSPDPVTGKRNYTYMEAIKSTLGGRMYIACGMVQYVQIIGMAVGYTTTTSLSVAAISRSDCYLTRGHEAKCESMTNLYIIGMGIIEIFLSQIPNFHELSLISIIAAIMSFSYSSIGVGLAFAKLISEHGRVKTSLFGVEAGMNNVSAIEKTWLMFSAFGDIAFAFSYALILIEIQDTLKSTPPENKTMKKANAIALSITTTFYTMCGCFGYAAFGNKAPGNLLTGFYEPFWLVDLANVCIVVHLIGAYQVFVQPLFSAVELWARTKYPDSSFITNNYTIIVANKLRLSINLFRLTWRTMFVMMSTIIAMLVPFFNDLLGLLGAIGYWPLTVYFPITMYISQKNVRKWSIKWLCLQFINMGCLLIAIAAACGSIRGISKAIKNSKPFKFKD